MEGVADDWRTHQELHLFFTQPGMQLCQHIRFQDVKNKKSEHILTKKPLKAAFFILSNPKYLYILPDHRDPLNAQGNRHKPDHRQPV